MDFDRCLKGLAIMLATILLKCYLSKIVSNAHDIGIQYEIKIEYTETAATVSNE